MITTLNSDFSDYLQNDLSFKSIWEELKWRGIIHVSTDEEELKKLLDNKKITYYCGFDPTAPSLHLGNLIQLLLMRRLQLAGHRPIVLVGGSTGLIGDPRQNSERVMNDRKTVSQWVKKISSQVSKFLSFQESSNSAKIVNNIDWTESINAIDFLRDIGKHFRINKMLAKDVVNFRLKTEAGMSYTEFSYQILQGIDFLELYRQYGCVLQTGGSDQWGNFTSGIDLIARVEKKNVHAIGTPLITNSNGVKFGKTEGNAIWLDKKMTTPFQMYQFWLNIGDQDVIFLLKIFTFLSRKEIEYIAQITESDPSKRIAQKKLAYEVTSIVHGVEIAEKVKYATKTIFTNNNLSSLSEPDLLNIISQFNLISISKTDIKTGINIIDAVFIAQLSRSKSDAQRAIKSGSVYVNSKKILNLNLIFKIEDFLYKKYLIMKRGKNNLSILKIEN